MKQHDVIISGLNMDLTDAIRNVVEQKVEKLFEHEDHIVRMRVELEYDAHKRTHQNEFIAKGHLEVRGNDHNAHAETDDLYKCIETIHMERTHWTRRDVVLLQGWCFAPAYDHPLSLTVTLDGRHIACENIAWENIVTRPTERVSESRIPTRSKRTMDISTTVDQGQVEEQVIRVVVRIRTRPIIRHDGAGATPTAFLDGVVSGSWTSFRRYCGMPRDRPNSPLKKSDAP